MGELVAIITLAILVLAQLVERYLYSKNMTQKLSESMKAVMSRNINEFMAITQDKQPKQEFTQNENVLIDEATDEVFNKVIEKMNIPVE